MLTTIFDVETIGGQHDRAALEQMASKCHDERDREPERFAALSPYLCEVACICVRCESETSIEEGGRIIGSPLLSGSVEEPDVLDWFNGVIASASRLVTFGGRWFDLPVVISRMLARGIGPAPNLLRAWREPRYKPERHIDLIEVLTQGGASKKPSLREVCLGWGLPDPKAGGDGADVGRLIAEGRHADLMAYCAGDVKATAAIHRKLVEFGIV